MKNKLLEILGLEKIIHSIQSLVETRIALIKEEIEEKVAESIAKAIPIVMIALAAFLFILFGSITLGLYLSIVLESYIAGFGIITAFYLLLVILFAILKNSKSYNEGISKQIKKRN